MNRQLFKRCIQIGMCSMEERSLLQADWAWSDLVALPVVLR